MRKRIQRCICARSHCVALHSPHRFSHPRVTNERPCLTLRVHMHAAALQGCTMNMGGAPQARVMKPVVCARMRIHTRSGQLSRERGGAGAGPRKGKTRASVHPEHGQK